METTQNETLFYIPVSVANSEFQASLTHGDALFIAGFCYNGGVNKTNALLVKYHQNGTLLWQRELPGTGVDRYNAIACDDSHIYAAGSQTTHCQSGCSTLLVQYDFDGNVLWQRTLDGVDHAIFSSVCVHKGYIYAAGNLSVKGQHNQNASIMKYDVDGTLLWQKVLSEVNTITYVNAIACDDDALYIAGHELNMSTLASRGFIAKYSEEGELLWRARVQEADNSTLNSLQVVKNSALDEYFIYAVGSVTTQTGYITRDGGIAPEPSKALFTIFDTDGNSLWRHILADDGYVEARVIAYEDASIYVAGRYVSTKDYKVRSFIANYYANGAIRWQFGLETERGGEIRALSLGKTRLYAVCTEPPSKGRDSSAFIVALSKHCTGVIIDEGCTETKAIHFMTQPLIPSECHELTFIKDTPVDAVTDLSLSSQAVSLDEAFRVS